MSLFQHVCDQVDWLAFVKRKHKWMPLRFRTWTAFSRTVFHINCVNGNIHRQIHPFSPCVHEGYFLSEEKKTQLLLFFPFAWTIQSSVPYLPQAENAFKFFFLHKFSMDFHIRIKTSWQLWKVDMGHFYIIIGNSLFLYDLAKFRWHDHGLSETHYFVYCIFAGSTIMTNS